MRPDNDGNSLSWLDSGYFCASVTWPFDDLELTAKISCHTCTRTLENSRPRYAGTQAILFGASQQELARVTRGGGWVELVESTFIRDAGPGLTTISRLVGLAVGKMGINFATSERLGEFLRGAGLQNVKQEVLQIPFGAWGGRLGIMMQQDYLAVFGSLKAHVLRFNIADQGIWDKNWNMALAEAHNPAIHAIVPIIVAYGQRPRYS